jgi:D-cysteine desulfhydrase family pyridoxal phosphate-dependent enzyme
VTSDQLTARLAALPRVRLATVPTPLDDAVRLRDALGGRRRCPRILVKRDDLTGLGLGGNKARKLDFLLGEALADGATSVITTGAVQSNHARMTAAAARRCGLDIDLVLTATVDDPPAEGNLLLDRLFGARVHFVPAVDPMLAVGHDEATVLHVAAQLTANGGRPYIIPVGGSSPVGALGYVAGTLELAGQLAALRVEPTRVYYASGSRGTQAGLTLGAHLLGCSYALHGVAVSAGEPEKIERARRAATEAAALLGADNGVGDARYFTDQGFIGEGYGVPSPEGLEALILAARTEALVLDPTYTAKALAALVAHVRSGELSADETVVFLHTGGAPATLTAAAAAHLAAAPGWQIPSDLH